MVAFTGRVGRAHGIDGSFYVEDSSGDLEEGMTLTLDGRPARVERRGGLDARPLVRLSGVSSREAAREPRPGPGRPRRWTDRPAGRPRHLVGHPRCEQVLDSGAEAG